MPDARFARIKSDPRFRRPRKLQSKVVVDDRFKSIFTKDKKTSKNKTSANGRNVDKYGRPLPDTHERDNLRRFYRLENEDTPDTTKPDYARGEVLMESSDESEDVQNDESDLSEIVELGDDYSGPIALPGGEAEVDLDESQFAELDAQAVAYSKAHSHKEKEDQPEAKRTRRLAVVNLDWDHVKAIHLYKIFSSLVSPTAPALVAASGSADLECGPSVKGGSTPVARGSVLNVRIYPSQFGKERLAREEKEGPPPEIFRKRRPDDNDEITGKTIYEVGEQDDHDDVALRHYQLERLRYYYAIVTCDTVDAASHIYTELDGTELERSANVLDLSFVPDDMIFDDEWRDEANAEQVLHVYKALDFVTPALRHSKVALTWDDDDHERTRVTRRALTRKEIEEGDFKAYIASSSGSESETEVAHPDTERHKIHAISRRNLRILLLGRGDDEMPEGWGSNKADQGDIDMEITFTPGLSEVRGDRDETTLERYQRKMKEKRKTRKSTVKEDGMTDAFFDLDDEGQVVVDEESHNGGRRQFSKKLDPVQDTNSRSIATPSQLALLVTADNSHAEPEHFNMKAIVKAEKASQRKAKKMKRQSEDNYELQGDFTINVQDQRFKALYEDHAFALDPTNPRFTKSKSMIALMRARPRMHREDKGLGTPTTKDMERPQTLLDLVESVKRKAATVRQPRTGKRRKL